MAVGDGFNDAAMIKMSDVGIQIRNQDVPILFGDIIVGDIKYIEDLMFKYGKQVNTNLLYSLILVNAGHIFMISLFILADLEVRNPKIFISEWQSGVFFALLYFFVVVGICLDSPYAELGNLRKAIYTENRYFISHFWKIYIATFFWGILEGFYLLRIETSFVSRTIGRFGYMPDQDMVSLHSFISMVTFTLGKVIVFRFRKSVTLFLLVASFFVACILGLLGLSWLHPEKTLGFVITDTLTNLFFYYTFPLSILVPLYLAWVGSGFLKFGYIRQLYLPAAEFHNKQSSLTKKSKDAQRKQE